MLFKSLRIGSIAALAAAAGTLSSCAGNGEGLDENGNPATGNGGSSVLTADFKSIQDNIFTPICTVCHIGSGAPVGLQLDAANSYMMLVGINSGEVPALKRVQPGNPDSSYLMQKILGVAAVGVRMPANGPPYLSSSQIDAIRQWIVNGAQRPAAKPLQETSANGLSVVAASPLNADVLARSRPLLIGFDRELDSTLVNSTTVFLTDVGSRSATVPVRLEVIHANPMTLSIAPIAPLAPGHYVLTLRGSGGGALAGFDAKPLGFDGASGRDFTVSFQVEAQ